MIHSRKYPPLTVGNALVSPPPGMKRMYCHGCGAYFHSGDETCVVIDDATLDAAHATGDYDVSSKPYHWRCKPVENAFLNLWQMYLAPYMKQQNSLAKKSAKSSKKSHRRKRP